jgi:phosphoribosylamine-glycine ligase
LPNFNQTQHPNCCLCFTETVENGCKFGNTEATYVLKADGLAGKGVLIIQDLAEAKEELRNMLYIKIWKPVQKWLLRNSRRN